MTKHFKNKCPFTRMFKVKLMTNPAKIVLGKFSEDHLKGMIAREQEKQIFPGHHTETPCKEFKK
jgi:hypothetical protein